MGSPEVHAWISSLQSRIVHPGSSRLYLQVHSPSAWLRVRSRPRLHIDENELAVKAATTRNAEAITTRYMAMALPTEHKGARLRRGKRPPAGGAKCTAKPALLVAVGAGDPDGCHFTPVWRLSLGQAQDEKE